VPSLEMPFHLFRRNIFELGGIPSRVPVLVDDRRPHAFDEIVIAEDAEGDTEFLFEAGFGLAVAARLAQRLERNFDRAGRRAADLSGSLLRLRLRRGIEGGEDRLGLVMGVA